MNDPFLNLFSIIEDRKKSKSKKSYAARWEQARQAGAAPKVVLNATNKAALAILNLDDLEAHAAN